MKKLLSILIIVVACGGLYVGCNKQSPAPKEEPSSSATKPASDDGSQTKNQDDAKPAPPSDGSGSR